MAVNSELNEESLFAHNYLRKRHGCPPLEYDEELAKSSQAFADKLAHSPRLKYYYPTDYGENVAYRVRNRDANLTGIEATLRWYREILNFISGRENQAKCGHFAQVIWKKTKHAGFGMAKSVDGKRAFVVGRYKPRGSRRSYWQEHVPPPTDNQVYVPTSEEMGELLIFGLLTELYKEAMAEKSGEKKSYEDYVKSILYALNTIRVEKKLPPLLFNPTLIKKTRSDLSEKQELDEGDQSSKDDDEQKKILTSKLIDPTRIANLMLRNGQVIRKDITMAGITLVLMPQASTVVTFGEEEVNLSVARLDVLPVECDVDFHGKRCDTLENEAILLVCSLAVNQNEGLKMINGLTLKSWSNTVAR
ncbi:Golgi-associated plant pathogenesis-related protein 1 [Taenia crassiceps]|uniref:Golgi-associated plant pathogenesis-related protein 1 n=1 Tax=Taenia crassiceps TaxID=6207 RepID=A0ABR4Q5G3_9CEST